MEEAIWTPLILHLPPPSHHSIHTSLHSFIQLRPHMHADPCAPTTSCMLHSPALHTAISASLLLTFCLSAPLFPPPHACLTFPPISTFHAALFTPAPVTFPCLPISVVFFTILLLNLLFISFYLSPSFSCHLIVSLLQLSIHSSLLSPHSFLVRLCV